MTHRRATPCAAVVLGLALQALSAVSARGQEEPTDAVGRESTVHNDIAPRPGIHDSMSREWTAHNHVDPRPVSSDGASREFTVYNSSDSTGGIADVFSREFTAHNDTTLTAIRDSVSREFVGWNLMPEGIEDGLPVPGVLTVLAARPNPSTGRTTLPVGLPREALVTLAVYDVTGACVAKPHDRHLLPAGWHGLAIDATGWAPGVYFCRLDAGGTRRETKIILRR